MPAVIFDSSGGIRRILTLMGESRRIIRGTPTSDRVTGQGTPSIQAPKTDFIVAIRIQVTRGFKI